MNKTNGLTASFPRERIPGLAYSFLNAQVRNQVVSSSRYVASMRSRQR
jgi:hypothetical protein